MSRLPVALLGLGLLAAPDIGRAQAVGHDTSLPIEITADSLEVVQDQQVATFSGNVDAVQGDIVLTADKLRVYYQDKAEDAGLSSGSSSAIRRIEAEGNVSLASPDETAKGEFGTYDVPQRLVTLEGGVVLTRDENVIRGNRLEMDLANGVSRMLPAAGDDGGEGRVKALFTPRERGDDAASTSEGTAPGGGQGPRLPAPRPQ